MADCPYYQIATQRIKRRPISADRQRQPPVTRQIPWCSHELSPVDEEIALRTLGGGQRLKCGGIVSNCQIPADQFRRWTDD